MEVTKDKIYSKALCFPFGQVVRMGLCFLFILFFQNLFAQKIIVNQNGSGNFKSIQDAINSLPKDDGKTERIIFIKKGIYKEKIFIDKNFITLQGEDVTNTIITISLARDEWKCYNMDDYGTAAINLKGNDITLENLTISNTYGKDVATEKQIICNLDSGKIKTIKPTSHQMALRSFTTTRLKAINCVFIAYGGDTVSPWNIVDGMFYFKDCIMEGGVDFYCPRGSALAEHCTFICHNNNAAIWHDGSGNINHKTVLYNCSFTGDDGYKLGRFHRDAQFYVLNCTFSNNMADADIYWVPSKAARDSVRWGRRVYYYNCKKENGNDYTWYQNNLPIDWGINEYNIAWVYDYKWNPSKNETYNTELKENIVVNKTDSVADNMLLYQRANGGWPKHFIGDRKVDYKKTLSPNELKLLKDGYGESIDATIDNEATTKEIKYLVKAYKIYTKKEYLNAAIKGIEYLLKAQYINGGWPQFYPDFSSYRGQITYNDNAMVNVLNVLQDVAEGKNGFDVITDGNLIGKCTYAPLNGIVCILKTQIKQKKTLTAWCTQYNAKTLKPEMARKYELPSISGQESVGIIRFLMRQKNPSPEIINAVHGAIVWLNKVKIIGYNLKDIKAPNEQSGRDRVLVKEDGNTIWARFYDVKTNQPFFCGRDSKPKKTLAEVENERRIGYAWYGTWPQHLINVEYPDWLAKITK
jgi:PelA/Pel-15E family pectate lyase